MGLKNKIAQYRGYRDGVKHCTFDPEGPGVVRIHLVPPKFRLLGSRAYILILNGYYLLPLGYAWAVMLSAFIDEVNRFAGKAIRPEEEAAIEENTLKRVRRIYPGVAPALLKQDLDQILCIIFAVARGEKTDFPIEKLSIRSYGRNMTAPHRMDLMVSAMTDSCGKWQCNQKCIFCYAAGQPLSGVQELSTGQWKQAIDTLQKAHVPMVTFTGGEPTLRQDLPELVAHASWMVTRLNTNGVNLTEDLVQKLKSASLDSLQVTLYSHDPQIHNGLVGSDHHSDTVQGIKNALSAGLDVSVNTPLCQKNRDYLKTLEFLHALGVRFVTLSGLICTGMAHINHEEYDLSEKALLEILKAAKDYCDTHGMEMDFTSPGLVSKEALEALGLHVPMCGACLSNMAIAPDGTVIPCQSWLGSDASLGNILTTPFKTIWKHPATRRLQKMNEEQALHCPFRTGKAGGAK